MKYKYLFFDFNGTLIDDVDLCLTILNDMLTKRGYEKVTYEKYKHIFTFPIIDYYRLAGFDFEKESFKDLAVDFVNQYYSDFSKCGLFSDVYDVLKECDERGYKLVLFSASEKKALLEQIKFYGIDTFFSDVLGLDNFHASSKIEIGLDYINRKEINPKEILFIGDTLHDKETADILKTDCILVSSGHQAFDVLKKGNNIVVKNLNDILGMLE